MNKTSVKGNTDGSRIKKKLTVACMKSASDYGA